MGKLTEKEYKEQVYELADKVKTSEDLRGLLADISTYNHDYGTIVYGCAAAMRGAFNVINKGASGGITGFQAGCLGWQLVEDYMSIKAPARILDFKNMLYPQYEAEFQKTISKDAWELLQKKDKKQIEETERVHPDVLAHWNSIVEGNIPFGWTLKAE